LKGGVDTDSDDNPNTNNAPITNKGILHAIVFAEDLFGSQSIIASPVTEIVYQRLQGMIGTLSPSELRAKLNDVSAQLLTGDITGNNLTDYKDILAFDPSKSEMYSKLVVPFNKYHQQLSHGKSFIQALRDNDQNATQYSAELLGSNAPNIELPETNIASNVKLDIYLSGSGVLESALFKTGHRDDTEGNYQIAVPRSLKEEYALTVKPNAGHSVVSWVGCSSISEDRKTCLIKPDQSKSVYAVLATEAVFKPNVKGHQKIPMNANVEISDRSGIMTISTKDAQLGVNLMTMTTGMVMSLPYLPHPLVKATEIVSRLQETTGTEIRFKFVDVQLTDILEKATFYSTPEYKPNIGLDDVVSVSMITDKTILKNPQFNLTDGNFKKAIPLGNPTTPITPRYKDKSGGNHVGNKAWEMVIHKDRCVIYADETPPAVRPTIPTEAKNDTVWTAALRAAEGECDNKTLVYKAYKDYALDFQLTNMALNTGRNTNHVRFANMAFMQHMDKKSLANTPLYLISGTKKGGETMRTAAAWTWAKGIGPVLKVRKNVYLARKSDGRSGFDIVSFDDNYHPQSDLYNVSDFSCLKGSQCKLSDAQLPHASLSRQVTHNPWYFGPNDPLPSPYKRAVDTNNLMPLFGTNGLSVDFPFKNSPLSVGVNAKVGVGMSVDWFWEFELLNAYAALKLIPEIAIEPRLEFNVKASKATSSKSLEVPLIAINLAYLVSGPVASIIRPEISLNAGIEFGGEGGFNTAYTRGMKAKFGVDAYYNADFDATTFKTTVDKHLNFPSSFDTYKSDFEYSVEGQFYSEPYLELRLEGSVTGVAENLANLAARGFVNASVGFEAGVAVAQETNKSEAQVRADIKRINDDYTNRLAERRKTKGEYEEDSAVVADVQEKIHDLYDKQYSADFINQIFSGSYTHESRLQCRIGLKFGLDAGVRATASFNPQNIKFLGEFLEKSSITLLEQRWPIKLALLDKLNEQAIECTDLEIPVPVNIEQRGTANLTWKTESYSDGTSYDQYSLIECGSWQDCQKQATLIGAKLAVITSSHQNNWIINNIITNKGKPAWIGLSSFTPEGYNAWATGEALNYSNWNGEANSESNNGVAIQAGGQWSAANQSITRAVIQKATVSVTPSITWKNNRNNGNDYALVECGTWKQCLALAQANKVQLADINNAQESQWLVSNILAGRTAWIGLNDLSKEGTYTWSSSNKVATYTNWNSGEPNDANNEDVIVTRSDGRWNDASINDTNTTYAVFKKAGKPQWNSDLVIGKSYLLIDCETWQDCQEIATSIDPNARLATFDNTNDSKSIAYNLLFLKNRSSAWIGLNDLDQEGQYRWTNANTYLYSNWASGEPNNAGNEDAVALLNDGSWVDKSVDTNVGAAVIEILTGPRTPPITWKKNPSNDNEYTLIDCSSWSECAGSARKLNANLVTIRSASENKWLVDNILNGQSAWVGLTRKGLNNFIWAGLEAVSYTNWDDKQPINTGGKEVAAIFGDGRWQTTTDSSSSAPIIRRALLEKGKNIVAGSDIQWKTNPSNSHRYARVTCGTWEKCKLKATLVGAYLAVVTSDDENQWLYNNIYYNPSDVQARRYWLGYSDTENEGRYKWVNGNDVFGSGLYNKQTGSGISGIFDAGAMEGGGYWTRMSVNDAKVTEAFFEQDEKSESAPTTTNTIVWTTNPTNSTEYTLVNCDTWKQCEAKARTMNARLATVANAEVNKWLVDNILSDQTAWIGLNDIDEEDKFKWLSSAAYNYKNWNSGEPNNVGDEDAVSMRSDGKWNDNTVNFSLGHAVFERDLVSVVVDAVTWKINPNNNNEYAIVNCDSWRKCEAEAKSMNARIVSITTASLNSWIVDNLLDNKAAWIGLNDIDQEGSYQWSGGEDFDYKNWNTGEPNNYQEEDVASMLGNGKWNDDSVNTNIGRAVFERVKSDWKVNPANNHSYRLIKCNSWAQCQAQAQKLGANLVTINDEAEQTWLTSSFSSTTRYWIGLTDKAEEDVFTWISGESTSYRNWNKGEPNNYNDEDYAELVENGKWNDADASDSTSTTHAVIEKK
jgi:hypothetical protein